MASPKPKRFSSARLPTAAGDVDFVVYHVGDEEVVAIVSGQVDGVRGVLSRVHSECLTGEVFGSLRCDCRAQLDLAIERITADAGVVVYLRQEGRGIGLGNKIKAYALQDQGHDTVDANLELGFEADSRSYEFAAAVLRDLGVASVRLMTNNPKKADGLRAAGIEVDALEAHWVGESEHNKGYLDTKRERLGHVASGEQSGDEEPGKEAS